MFQAYNLVPVLNVYENIVLPIELDGGKVNKAVSYTHLDVYKRQVIYEGKTFPVGTLACDALNVPANTITKMNEQCEKINLLLGKMCIRDRTGCVRGLDC